VSLPDGWALARLSEVCSKIVDGSHNPPKATDSGFPMLSARNIQDRRINFDDFRFINEGDFSNEHARTNIQAGDVLLTIVGSIGRTAVVTEDVKPFALQRSVAVLKPLEINSRYLSYLLESPTLQRYFQENAKGTAQKGIYLKALAEVEISLAPFNEQKRIVDKLDTLLARLDACRERLDRVPQVLKHFRQAVLAAATSGTLTEEWRNVEAPEWRHVCLADISEIQGGVTKDSKKQQVTDEEVPYLRVANVQRGYLDLNEIKTIRIPSNKIASILLEPGDILFNEGGDIDKLGRGWIWEGQIPRCSFQNHVFRVRLFSKSDQPKYISWWGNSRGVEYFLRQGKQTTNLASINKTMLGNLPVSLPPPDEQQEIVRRVETLFAYADRLDARYITGREMVDQLIPALLDKAFSGELTAEWREQNPDLISGENSADALLARIKTEKAEAVRTTITHRKSAKTKTGKYMKPKMIISVAVALKAAGTPLTAQALLTQSGYPSDATTEDLERFFLDIRDQLKLGSILCERSGDDDIFTLVPCII